MKSKLYPIIACLFDIYIFSFFLGGVFALIALIQPNANGLFLALGAFVLSLIVTLIYHIFVARKVSWLTPGEIGTGRVIEETNKVWRNLYGINRWALFILIFSALVIGGNSWDRLGLEEFPGYSIGEIIARLIALSIITYGVIQVGRGRIWMGLIFVAYSLLTGIGAFTSSQFPDIESEVMNIVVFSFVGLGCVQLVILLVYAFRMEP